MPDFFNIDPVITAAQRTALAGATPVPVVMPAGGGSAIGADGSPVSGGGPVTSGVWMTPPSIFRLRLTGTGTAAVDARDKLGAITLGIATYSPSAATNQIEYPYLGETAADMRVTLTGDVAAEVM